MVHEEEKEAELQDSCRPSYLDLTNGNSSSVSHKSLTPREQRDMRKDSGLTYLPEGRQKSSSVRGERPRLNRDKKSRKDVDGTGESLVSGVVSSEDVSSHDVYKGFQPITKKDRVA